MKRALLALTLAAALPFTASAAEGISYNYAEAGYAKTDAKYSQADSDGWAIGGSYAFLPNFHVFGNYSKQETDSWNYPFNGGLVRVPGFDVDTWRVGVGYNHELSKRVDLVTRIAYEQAKSDFGYGYSDKLKGGSVEAGVRGSLTPNWEGYAFAGYQDYDKHYDGKFYGRIGTLVKFNQNWGITADAKFIDGGEKEFFVGPRFSF
ncbi:MULTISPECIES: diffusible signal factor-reguated Ax21 faimly protein [unclassified Lysobacter]|uniref:porin n=1 Tax=unclassified Lysobacter TaxID=2635362 RepID=UPI001BEBD685|nr:MULTISPECIES: diffusible signal factor-reguated Ax21 faimly protein [unclassified Lysobacter]MBT2745729.1 porin [Lysobacter sp. ISL-42]MBT2749712.1 porin [Lysobacter sp. ISL-50]MBT2777569.1 porin [Lysobacter sp. ISL-54]MBT2782057.1 porin [Lysobacter sp. ISL-52]